MEYFKVNANQGKFYIWKYINNRNYKGWNFVCDSNGRRVLLDLFIKMKNGKYSSRVTLLGLNPNHKVKTIPSKILAKSKVKYCDNIDIDFKNNIVESKLIENNNSLHIIINKDYFFDLENSVQFMSKGVVDCGLEFECGEIFTLWSIT